MAIKRTQAPPRAGSLANMFRRPKGARLHRDGVGGIGGSVASAWKTWSRKQRRVENRTVGVGAADVIAAAAAVGKAAEGVTVAANGKKKAGRPRNDGRTPGSAAKEAPPLWATWSLGRNADAQKTPSIVIDDTHVSTVTTGTGALGTATITTLLRHRNDDDIYSSQWEDYFDDTPRIDAQESMTTAVKRVKSFKAGRPMMTASEARSPASLLQCAEDILSGEPTEDKNFLKDLNNQILNKPGFLRFDPLTLIESTNLARCLRLSRYVPEAPTPQEPVADAELAFVAPSGKKLTFLEGLDTKRDVRVERRKEAAKRDPTAGQRPPGRVDAIKNEAAKELFKSMCRLLLPRRHFDWIVAQLTYGRTEMLGRVPAALSLNGTQRHYADKAKKAVERGEMSPDNAALVLHALADASRLSMDEIELVDPHIFTANLSVSERRRYKQKQRAEAATVTRVLRLLFPEMFGIMEGTSDAKLARHARKEAMRRLAVIKQARDEARVQSDKEAQTMLPSKRCGYDADQRGKTYAETATQTNESAVAQVQASKPKRPFPFTPYETMLPKVARKAQEVANHKDGRGPTSSTRDNSEAPADDDTSVASGEENEDAEEEENENDAAHDEDYGSDWGDLEYEPVPIDQILDAVVYTMEDHKKLYEMAMISFHGRMPKWLKTKFKRDCRQLYKLDRKVEMEEQAKIKKKKDAENKLLQLARERELAQVALQKKREQNERDKERIERQKEQAKERAEREAKRKRNQRKKLFRLNKHGKLVRPPGQPRRGDDEIYQEVLAEIREREARQFEIETERATRRLKAANNRSIAMKRKQDNVKFKAMRERLMKKRSKKNMLVSPDERDALQAWSDAFNNGQVDVLKQLEGQVTFVDPYTGEVNDTWQPAQLSADGVSMATPIDPRLLSDCLYATAGAGASGSGYVVQSLASMSSVNGGPPPLPPPFCSPGVSSSSQEDAVGTMISAEALIDIATNDTPRVSEDEDTTMVNGGMSIPDLHPAFSQVDLDMLIASVSPVGASDVLPTENMIDGSDKQAVDVMPLPDAVAEPQRILELETLREPTPITTDQSAA